jgi:HK97 family phage major capsid protein
MEIRTIKSQVLLREAQIEIVERSAGKNGEEFRDVTLSLSSELPVDQWFGREILVHDSGAVRLNRMNNGAPLLLNHNSDSQIGAFKRGTVKIGEDKKLRGTARFSRSDHAQEIANDVDDDIRTSTSVGYRVYAMERARDLEELDAKGQPLTPVYRVTDWEPVEASIVPVPADPTVGKGRMMETENDITVTDPLDPGDPTEGTRSMEPTPITPPAAPAVDLKVIRAEAAESERSRIADIDAIAKKFNLKEEFVRKHKDASTPSDQFARLVINEWSPEMIKTVDMRTGMTPADAKRFSIARGVKAIMLGDWSEAGFEKEVCAESRKRQVQATGMDRGPKSFTVPWEVTMEKAKGGGSRQGQRDLLAQSGEGPETIETSLRANEFIELLRPVSVLIQAGARVLTGLVGNVNFPRLTAGGTAAWVAEGSAPSETTPALDVLSLVPRTVIGYTDISRQLILQSTPAAEGIVRDDLTMNIGTQLDIAGLRGAGAPAPTGISATSGIGGVAFGTNGAAPTNALMVEFLTDVANANALKGALAFVMNPNTMGKLMTTERATNTGMFMWNDNAIARPVYGYPAFVTTNLRSTLVKGSSGSVCSEMIFGNFSELFMAFWGGLDILVDPYTASTTGTVRIVAAQSADIGLRHPLSFSYAADILTT